MRVYISTDGDIRYFAEITGNKKCIVLKMEPEDRSKNQVVEILPDSIGHAADYMNFEIADL